MSYIHSLNSSIPHIPRLVIKAQTPNLPAFDKCILYGRI
jgi:hypothetical protein